MGFPLEFYACGVFMTILDVWKIKLIDTVYKENI